ncbi:MAG: hypothetical protein IPL46_30510 [Saprospiraceae bacterium]|nr:hypothetical protein [Saprospiraceae bacterium]
MRRLFHLPEQDVEYLEVSGLPWETIISNGNWLLVHNFSIPRGYNEEEASIALRLDPGYPTSQIDMVYFHPHLVRSDGKMIRALAMQQLDGKQWQRWSRHRTHSNPWRPDVDCISTHISLVDYWLNRELQLR